MNIKFEEMSSLLSSRLKPLKLLLKPSFLSSPYVSIGLDIGKAYIKAISLEKANEAVNITGFSCQKIAMSIKDSISKALSDLSLKKRELALSISGQSVALRYVNMPIMTHEELTKSMAFELEKYVPFKKDEVNFDLTILKKNKNTGKMLVLIAAAKKDIVDNRISLCRSLGYHPNFVDVCPLAIANYFGYVSNAKEGVCAIVNLGATVSSVDIIEDGLLVLSRDIFIGGNDFTKRVSEILNKEFNQAEEIKIETLNDDLIPSLEPIFNNLVRELKASFDFYESQSNRLIDKILITGGSVKLKGIIEFFKHSLGQDVEIITFNPDKFRLKPSLNAQDFKQQFNFFSVALGIALRDLS